MKPSMLLTFLVLFCASQGQAVLQWEYESPLTVTETITDMGDGTYLYEYSFVNNDNSPIWDFGLFTSFLTEPEWHWETLASTAEGIRYDGRDLDPDIVFLTYFYTSFPGNAADPPSFPGPLYIDVGEAAFGLSFTAAVYDPTPNYYFYETHASDWAGRTGKVAAVGQTIPEPSILLILASGALALRWRQCVPYRPVTVNKDGQP